MELDLNQKEEYKETELGLLPKDWEVVRLGEVSELQQGKTPKRDDYEDYKGYRIIKVKDYENENKISNIIKGDRSFVKTDFGERYTIKEGDSLILSAAHSSNIVGQKIGYVKEIPSQKTFFVAELIRVRPKKNIIPYFSFLSLILMSSRNQIREEVKGGHLYPKNLGKIKISLPPLSEQKKIAYVLSTVQEAKEKTEDVIKATKELKKSMMKHLFTYGPVSLEEAENIPLKETEIGLLPEEWEVVKLGDLFENKSILIQFGFPCGKWNDKGSGVPHLRPFNVSNDGQIVLKDLKFIDIDRDINRYLLKKGDILFNNTNSQELVGKTAYWNRDGDFVISNHMTFIRILNLELINSLFLANYLHKKWYDGFYLEICRRHVNQASISLARLKQILIPLPPLTQQKKIASILSAIDQKIEVEESKKKVLEDLFKSLLHNLMTAKIRLNHLEEIYDE